jgi:hypothetical protein
MMSRLVKHKVRKRIVKHLVPSSRRISDMLKLHCRGKQKKTSPTSHCSNRIYRKNISLHQRLHIGRALLNRGHRITYEHEFKSMQPHAIISLSHQTDEPNNMHNVKNDARQPVMKRFPFRAMCFLVFHSLRVPLFAIDLPRSPVFMADTLVGIDDNDLVQCLR